MSEIERAVKNRAVRDVFNYGLSRFFPRRQCADVFVAGIQMHNRGQLLREGYTRHFPSGAIHEISAPNGAGKSTVLAAIAGLVDINSGKITCSKAGTCLSPEASAQERASWLAWLPPDDDFAIPQMPIDVVLAGRWRFHSGKPMETDYEIAHACISATGLDPNTKKKTTELSSGQQRRLNLARVIAQDADILLLDEPWRGLDEDGRTNLHQLFQVLANIGRNIIIADPH